MRLNRMLILSVLASLTIIFLVGAAAFAFVGELDIFHESVAGLKVRPFPKGDIPNGLRLTVYESGIAAVTSRDLQAANMRFDTLSADELSLTREGRSVPFYVQGSGTDATLYFFAQAITNTLEAPAVYLLTLGQGSAMQQKKAAPTGSGSSLVQQQYFWEENSTFLTHTNGDDIWLGPLLLAPEEWTLDLSSISPSGGAGALTIRLWSSTQDVPNPDHHLQVLLNGRQLANWYWDGVQQETITLPLDEGVLDAAGANILTLRTPGDTGAAGEALYLDWIRLQYETQVTTGSKQVLFTSSASNVLVHNADASLMIFDVTDENAPLLLQHAGLEGTDLTFAGTGQVYVVLRPNQAVRPTISAAPVWKDSLRRSERGADYIAIVADVDGFAEALELLLVYRQEQGLRVTAVSLQQIYDEFGYGQQSPAAIRHFLTYATQNWMSPAPRYVLLVGDASYDVPTAPGAHVASGNLLPTSLVPISYNGYVASDTWFALEDSSVPQMAIGRFPVQTVAELMTMVNKTIAYETAPVNDRDWPDSALLVADDDEPIFDSQSDTLSAELKANGYSVHDLHMTDNDNIRYEIVSAINQGVGFLNYVGHGNERVWGDEFVFHIDDVRMLKNGGRLPVFTTFTCSNGAFALPDTDSLAEALLRADNGGAVAVIAPSGRMPASHTPPLAQYFYSALLDGGAETVGDAFLAMKSAEVDEPYNMDVLHLVNLLGDPALHIRKPMSNDQ
ncbi:MAG: hypothetical protein H6662_09180 [Ardenticatenaceae bacterium]|nr:hypothetical protein [Anaerolineales bacterium]MCB8921743.1 hypothetical protein [Ardenticatenaceae bacterium]MCB8990738.1 hypothetical protein [Ardenticatenaceae bacterium]